MPRLCANVTLLFADRPMPERIAAAAAAGFAGVEAQFPYDDPAPRLLEALDRAGLPFVLLNSPPPNWAGGPRGWAAVPGLEDRFRTDLRRAARLAGTLGARLVHVMAGVAEGPEARAAFVANLRWAAEAAPTLTLTVEPLNPVDMPGYFLADYGLALEIIEEVARPNLRLQFDTHHARVLTGDVHDTWERVRHAVGHVQVAGAGRHEPDDPAFLARLDAEGYAGWVGAEYNPKERTEDGLGWMPRG